jgi:site-specific recombinase XerD
MASLKILLYKSKVLKDGRHPIVIQVIHNRKVKKVSTNHNAFESEWDFEKNRPRKNHPNYKRLANYLNKIETEANDELIRHEEKDKDFDLDKFIAIIKNEDFEISFYEYVQNHINELLKAQKIGNAENYKTMLNVIKSFTNYNDFSIKQIDYKWLKNLETSHYNKGNSTNGLSVYLRALRAILNKAINEGILERDKYPFNQYKIKQQKTKKRAISRDNIVKIRTLEIVENTNIWHSKNYFLFSFYTRGMNWTDMVLLKKENISDGRITYKRAKTGKIFSIKLNEQIQEILNIYLNENVESEYVFPIINRSESAIVIQKDIRNGRKIFNKNLKKIAEMCQIETVLTSYVSRHSWATIAKKMGYSVEIIGEGLGHEDTKTTQIYLDDFDDDVLDNANDLITA